MPSPALLRWLILALLLVGLLVRSLRRPTGESNAPAAIDRVDGRYWLGGILYNNPDDPALFVPKRCGTGLTLNVGRPLGKALFLGSLLVPLMLVLLKRHAQG